MGNWDTFELLRLQHSLTLQKKNSSPNIEWWWNRFYQAFERRELQPWTSIKVLAGPSNSVCSVNWDVFARVSQIKQRSMGTASIWVQATLSPVYLNGHSMLQPEFRFLRSKACYAFSRSRRSEKFWLTQIREWVWFLEGFWGFYKLTGLEGSLMDSTLPNCCLLKFLLWLFKKLSESLESHCKPDESHKNSSFIKSSIASDASRSHDVIVIGIHSVL